MLMKRTAVCLLFLSALLPLTLPRCTRDGLRLLNTIRTRAPDWGSDTRLYTPAPDDFKKCPGSTLNCLAAEVQVLLDEWSLTEKRIHGLIRILGAQAQSFQQSELECGDCESFQEKTVETFLDVLKSFLQEMNSSC